MTWGRVEIFWTQEREWQEIHKVTDSTFVQASVGIKMKMCIIPFHFPLLKHPPVCITSLPHSFSTRGTVVWEVRGHSSAACYHS